MESKFNFAGEKIILPAQTSQWHSDCCEMNILTNPNSNSVSDVCKYQMIPLGNYFVPINQNDLYYVFISKPMKIIENCYGKSMEHQFFSKSGLLRLSEDCQISTDEIHLTTRNDHKLDMGEVELSDKKVNYEVIDEILGKLTALNNAQISKFNTTTLVIDHNNGFNELARNVDEMIEKIRMNEDFEQLRHDDYVHSGGQIGILTVILILGVIVLIFYIYRKIYSPNIWLKLEEIFEDTQMFPKLFTSKHKSHQSDIELHDMSDHFQHMPEPEYKPTAPYYPISLLKKQSPQQSKSTLYPTLPK